MTEPAEFCSEVVNSFDFIYYDAVWQEPVITEKCIFDLFKETEQLPYNYFAFPWATYIDNKWKNDRSLNELLDTYIPDPSKTYFTVCQHWRFREYMDVFKRIRIQYLFTPHCSTGDDTYEGIKILPLSLYPAQRSPREKISNILTRTILASFIGQYNPKIYMTDIRTRLFDGFAQHTDCLVKQRQEWHYQGAVYRGDMNGSADAAEEYIATLCNSKFSLCPSGCGPNTIRIWESLQCGSIPVILADTLILPPCNRAWKDCCVFWKETDIDGLYEHLKNIGNAQLFSMSLAGMKLYEDYFSETTMNRSIIEFFKDLSETNSIESSPSNISLMIDMPAAEIPKKVVFAFSLFGDKAKYTKGMIQNCEMIQKRFPDALIHIYLVNDVPSDIVDTLTKFTNVKIIPVEKKENLLNTLDRFFAIDEEYTEFLFVRDADSRVHERDACCIEDFINATKSLHIIRDHLKHSSRVMAGMVGIRKSLFPHNMTELIKGWMGKNGRGVTKYGCDTMFANNVLYPMLKKSMMVHDNHHHFKDEEITPFRYPIRNNAYVGQVV